LDAAFSTFSKVESSSSALVPLRVGAVRRLVIMIELEELTERYLAGRQEKWSSDSDVDLRLLAKLPSRRIWEFIA
jgi:hypothetical protein